MGQGGHFVLINHTPYNWVRTYSKSYQMDGWGFEENVAHYSVKSVYVEWDECIFHCHGDDSGTVVYELRDGLNSKITIHFQDANRRLIDVTFEVGERNQGNYVVKHSSVGWVHNGYINFGVCGKDGKYFIIGDDYSNWMQNNYTKISELKLKELTMLGSHDAGMSECGLSAGGATANNTVTQVLDIEGQLKLGTRYFDIRPVISAGEFVTGHYNIGEPFQCGANGQKLSSIISQLNTFLCDKKEFVILRISHCYNTDVGYGKYRSLNEDEWNGLLNQLSDINYRYVSEDDNETTLLDRTIKSFLDKGPRVIILLGANDCKDEYKTIKDVLDHNSRTGFCLNEMLNVYDQYSNTTDYDAMKNDQLDKLHTLANHTNQLFLLSWTLTQGAWDAIISTIGGDSILDMAEEANCRLCKDLYTDMQKNKTFPNIIYMDKIDTTDGAFMAMVSNDMVCIEK